MPGLTSGLNPEIVKTSLDEVFYAVFEEDAVPQVADALNTVMFRQETTDKGAVQTAEYEGTGLWTETAEQQTRVDTSVRTANKTVHTILKWTKTIPIPYEFYADDQHSEVNETIRHAAQRARTTRDKNALQKYPLGFTTTLTPDGAALFSTTHTSVSGQTIDNLETGVFTPTNLETIIRKLMVQVSQDGEWGGHFAAGLLVPPELFPDAVEFTKSELQPNTTDNNLNYFSKIYPGLSVFQSPFIGTDLASSISNSTTSYYLVGRYHGMTRWEREGISTDLVEPRFSDEDNWKYKGRYRETVSAKTWEGLVASNGTG